MSWAEIKKAVNSDLNKPLNELIEEVGGKISTTRIAGGLKNPPL